MISGHRPSVGVVLPTHDRPAQLRAALDAVVAQDYPGAVKVAVVYDRSEPDQGLADGERVRVLRNARTDGLAGARNTGILALDTDLIAFCDDDDRWLPGDSAQWLPAGARHFDGCGAGCSKSSQGTRPIGKRD